MATNKKTDFVENYPYLVYTGDPNATGSGSSEGSARTLTIALVTGTSDTPAVPDNAVTSVVYLDGNGDNVEAAFTATTYELGSLTLPAASAELPVGVAINALVETGEATYTTSIGGDVGVTSDGLPVVPAAEYGDIACLFLVAS